MPPRPIILHYVDVKGAATRRRVDVSSLKLVGDDCEVSGFCHLRQEIRTFKARNILEIASGETGEMLDKGEFLARGLGITLEQLALTVTSRRTERARTAELGLNHSHAHAIEGWAFSVGTCSRAALDIVHTRYETKRAGVTIASERVWTRGFPAVRSFAAGDIFYDPPQAKVLVWSEALKLLRRVVQIHKAKADTWPEGAVDVVHGEVHFSIKNYNNGAVVSEEKRTCSQAAFEYFLKHGVHADP